MRLVVKNPTTNVASQIKQQNDISFLPLPENRNSGNIEIEH